ncbi:MAG: multidrug efflux RND transporter periplasmic adaptor subunit AcrA [Terrimicrobiaceae bacterium]
MRRFFMGLALVAGIAGCDKKAAPVPPVSVTVTPVQQRDVTSSLSWVGLLTGFQNAEIRAQVTGYLISQNYREGGFVKRGDILFQLDARPFEAALAQAQADYAQKVANAQLAQITLQRQTELFKTKVISAQEFDVSAQDAAAATAAAAAAQASVQAAQVNLDYCTIQAPFDGVVGRAQAQIGDLVGPGGSAVVLTTMSQLDPIKAVFSITETEYLTAHQILQEAMSLPQDRLRKKITLRLADGTVYPHKGRFYFVNREINVATGTIEIDALFENPNNTLRPGLFVRVSAPVVNIPGALLVPQQAVMEVQGQDHVAVLNADNTASIRPVKKGPQDGPNIVITGQIQAGEKVVVGGIERVRPGMPLKVSEYQAPQPSPTPAETPEAQSAASPETSSAVSPSPTAEPKPTAAGASPSAS